MALKRPHVPEPRAQSTVGGSEAKKPVNPEGKTRPWKIISPQLRKDCPLLGILVIGETGTGKSTLINNLLGQDIAPVGHTMELDTLAVTPHEFAVEGVPIVVYDTPGLNDSRGDEDEKDHLRIMESLLARGKIHLVIYCFKTTETRMRGSLLRTFVEYHKMGVPWEQTIIALTFADWEEDPRRILMIQQHVKKTLAERVRVKPSNVDELKICPTAKDPNEALPTGRPWYVPFWLDVVEVLNPDALVRFLEIHEGNIHMEGMPASSLSSFVNITLAGEDKGRFEREMDRLSDSHCELMSGPTSSSGATPPSTWWS